MVRWQWWKILSSIKPTKKNWQKLSESTLPTLESNQRFAAIWGEFIQQKQLNLGENKKVCGILTTPTPILLFLVLWQP